MLTAKVDRDLWDSVKRTDRFIIDRNKNGWMFELEHVDSTQFEKADDLSLIGRLFENDKVLSVLFYDNYDYKMAFHVFNFRKSDMTPVSSHVVFQIGGDADDFWYRDVNEISRHKFEVTEVDGSYKSQGAQIIFRQKKEIMFDETTGRKKSVILSTEQDVYDKYFRRY